MAQDELTTDAKAQAAAVESYLRAFWHLDLDSELTEDILNVLADLNTEANLASLSDAQLGYLVRLLARPDRYRGK